MMYLKELRTKFDLIWFFLKAMLALSFVPGLLIGSIDGSMLEQFFSPKEIIFRRELQQGYRSVGQGVK
jgi:hypothetical protein